MPYDSGTPDGNNERYARYQSDNFLAMEQMNNTNRNYVRGQSAEPPRQEKNSLLSTVTNQAVGYAVQQGIKSLLSSVVSGGAAEAAGGAAIAGGTGAAAAAGTVAEVAAVAAPVVAVAAL